MSHTPAKVYVDNYRQTKIRMPYAETFVVTSGSLTWFRKEGQASVLEVTHGNIVDHLAGYGC